MGLLIAGRHTYAQTALYPPSPKIDFSNMGKTQSESKASYKELKKRHKEKMKRIKEMKKQMAEKTGWPKDSIDKYGDYMGRMKPKEFEDFKGKFDTSYDKSTYTEKGNALKERQKQRLEKFKGRYNPMKEKERIEALRNQAKLPTDSLGNPIPYDQLPDSLKLQYTRPQFDSLAYSPESLTNRAEQFGEQSMSTFLKDYELANAPTSQSLVSGMTEQFTPGTGSAQMTPYIAKFETYKDRRPTNVEPKKMAKGVAEARAKQVVTNKKNMIKEMVNQKNEAFKERTTLQRFQLGGYVQYHFQPKGLDVAPTVGFQLTRKLTIGAGYNKRWYFEADSLSNSGKRLFLQYDLIGSLFLHGESEWLTTSQGGELGEVTERNSLLGLGTKVKMGKFDGSMTVLYNLNPMGTIPKSRFTFRYGINLL